VIVIPLVVQVVVVRVNQANLVVQMEVVVLVENQQLKPSPNLYGKKL
jgi:hypothetical protein